MTLLMEIKEQKRESYAEGLADGEKRGTMQATLVSSRHLMTKLHMTAAEAMNFLEVPVAEREKYASQL